ncbi:uncharacterized protein LOC129581018 [Paramacrobiotus metropolitanus]|uniref:uncharacterized protein LOC129581018 n=1 Tax=Paramacrobiotus metropolitanus TaxID=2943436 RepID=UPI0024463702|nr:uncharacterized protein LOC129581018 [Paramacrobiotus metropolitanus]
MRIVSALVLICLIGALHLLQYPVDACHVSAASTYSPGLNVLRLLDEALQRSQNGVVHLEIAVSGQPFHQPIQLALYTAVREPEGANVTLPCGDDSMLQLPLIRYNGRPVRPESGRLEEVLQRVYLCRCNVASPNSALDSGLALLTDDPSMPTYFLQLYNFGNHLSGTYECLHMVNRELVVTNRYLISTRLMPNQVFHPPMTNTTVKVGEKAEFRCAVSFNTMPSERLVFEARFMWRNEHDLLYAPGVPAFQHDVRRRSEINVTSNVPENCLCHSTLYVESVQSQDAGRFECWFKIDDIFSEWVVQSAYLLIVE